MAKYSVSVYEPCSVTTDAPAKNAVVIAVLGSGSVRVVSKRISSGFLAVGKRPDPVRKGFTQFKLDSGEVVSYSDEFIVIQELQTIQG